jgi:hypothetical protein
MAGKLSTSIALSLALTLSWTPSLSAQSNAAGPTAELNEELFISFSFQVYVRGRADYSELYFFAAPNQPELLEINYGQKSQLFTYRGLPEFNIFRRVAGVGEEPFTYEKVASIDMTGRGNELLIFMTPRSRNGETRFSLAVMESVRQAVPPGTVAFFNGTGATFQGVLASRRLVIQPGLSEPISTSGMDTGEHVLLGLTVRVEETLEVVLETNVRFVPNRRTLYVLMPPATPGSLQIEAFRLLEGG